MTLLVKRAGNEAETSRDLVEAKNVPCLIIEGKTALFSRNIGEDDEQNTDSETRESAQDNGKKRFPVPASSKGEKEKKKRMRMRKKRRRKIISIKYFVIIF